LGCTSFVVLLQRNRHRGHGRGHDPTLLTYHRAAEPNEQEFMAATQATFKLGIRFENWRDVSRDYIHSFGLTGKDHWTAVRSQRWLKVASGGWPATMATTAWN